MKKDKPRNSNQISVDEFVKHTTKAQLIEYCKYLADQINFLMQLRDASDYKFLIMNDSEIEKLRTRLGIYDLCKN